MCTVTFIPTVNGVFLTSNRDEQTGRAPAIPPEVYSVNGRRVLYPKDPVGKGSWVVLKDNGDAVVLLNGAFAKHKRKLPYRKSRGLIVLTVIKAIDPKQAFEQLNLQGIEPFTLVLYTNGRLLDCRWDGFQKFTLELDADKPHIWSSATLYNKHEAAKRRVWLAQFLLKIGDAIDAESVWKFHHEAGKGDAQNNLVMARGNELQTLSITLMFLSTQALYMRYHDRQSNAMQRFALPPNNNYIRARGIERFTLAFRRFAVRLTNWEYWPAFLIFGPLFFYWIWLSLKARSFFFFSAANPGMQFSGFMQEEKHAIYQRIPPTYYPQTLYCRAGIKADRLKEMIAAQHFQFPLIAKPNRGRRGLQVRKLQSFADLAAYAKHSKVDFLLQLYIDYPFEVGIFYYRMPGEKQGHLSGIVGKEFLSVEGDGNSDLYTLLKGNERALFQLASLLKSDEIDLQTVLPKGVEQVISPYGNHSRGTKFLDLSHRINEHLEMAIDRICQQIPGFYYGRLDIKFNTWDDLERGQQLSIIELNGAGSEPAHMYDPRHSIFFAWREIARHWKVLYEISKANASLDGHRLMNTSDGIKMVRSHQAYLKQVNQV